MSLLCGGRDTRVGSVVLLVAAAFGALPGCPAPRPGCARNSDCATGSYCSAGACVTDCTPATEADDCDPGQRCSTFGMCVGGSADGGPAVDVGALDAGPLLDSGAPDAGPMPDSGGTDAGPPPPDAPDAPDLRPACVIAGGTDGDGDGYCAAAATDADCDDGDAAVRPGATEVCTPSTATFGGRAIDENCDGAIDESCGWYFGTPHPVLVMDSDADIYGFETPRMSEDGLRLYIRGAAGTGAAALVLARPSPATPFGPPEVVGGLGPGTGISSFGISADELEVYVQAPGTGGAMDIFRATRATVSAAFGAMAPVSEINDPAHDYHPFLRRDGLELFFGSARAGPGLGRVHRATRASTAAPWTMPQPLVFATPPSTTADSSPALSTDGLTVVFTGAHGMGRSIFMATRASPDTATFGAPLEVASLSVAGVDTIHPMVSEATAEIFFLSTRDWSIGRVRGLWRARICRDGPCPTEVIACPGGTRSPDGHHCYASIAATSWGSALAACGPGHLATIHSTAENALALMVSGGGSTWLGGYDGTPGVAGLPGVPQCTVATPGCGFAWVTGEPWIYSAWSPGEPNNFGAAMMEDALNLNGMGWNDETAAVMIPAVCESEEWPTW